MHEQVDSLKAGKADLKAKISQLEHEQGERVKQIHESQNLTTGT